MNELIPVNYDKEIPTASGRLLHEFLEVGTEYMKWFERMCEYGFTTGKDFSSNLTESTGGRPATDHDVTIPMAKEIAMIQRNEKGKQARQYFLRIEEAWNTPEMVMSRALGSSEIIGIEQPFPSKTYRTSKILARSNFSLARPYMERFMSFTLLLFPSTKPLLKSHMTEFFTAS